jgi:hypothetical protein
MCLNFIVVKIGCDNDNTIKIDLEEVINVVNTTTQSFGASGDSNVITVQFLKFVNGKGGIYDCPGGFVAGQKNDITTQVINNITDTQAAQIRTDIVNKITDQFTQDQTQGILAFLNSIGQAGSINNSTDITNKVKESVSNAITQEVVIKAFANTYTDQVFEFDNEGLVEGGSCKFIQENITNIQVNNLVTSVQTAIQKDAFLNDLLNYVKQTQTSGFTFNWLTYLIIGVVIIVIIIIIGAIIIAAKVV